jgi:O-antigen ligase
VAADVLSIEARPFPGLPGLPGLRRGALARWRSSAATTLLFLAGGVGVWRDERVALVVISLALTAVLLLLFGELAFQALVAWAVLAPLVFAFARFPSQHPILTFDRAWIAGLAAAVVLSASDRRAPATAPARAMAAALAWLVAAFGVRALTTSGEQTITIWIDAAVLPVVVFLVTRRAAATFDRCRSILGALTAAGAALGALGVAQKLFGFELASRAGGVPRFDSLVGQVRPSGPYAVPEVFAAVLLLCLAATLGWTALRGPAAYPLGVTAAALEIAAIGTTLFRAAWLAAIAVVVIVLGLRPRRPGRAALAMAVVGVVVVAVFTQMGDSTTVSKRLDDRTAVHGRMATYQVATALFREAPLFGIGIDRFEASSPFRARAYVQGVASLDHPHSSYVSVLTEQGLFGFVPFLAVTVAGWWLLHALRRQAISRDDAFVAAAVAAGAFAYWFLSLTLDLLPYGPSNAYLAVLLGVAAARLDVLGVARRAVEA